MRWIAGTLAFAAAFGFGTFMASCFVGKQMVAFETAAVFVESDLTIPSIDLPKELPDFDAVKATKPSEITVAYAGMVDEGEYPHLKFVVYNGTSGPLTYGAQASEWPFPDIRVNGRRPVLNRYRCGSGMTRFVIDPGASAEFRVGLYEFDKTPAEGSLITVGYYLSDRDGEFGQVVFSQPFLLPNGFPQAIKQWNKMQEDD